MCEQRFIRVETAFGIANVLELLVVDFVRAVISGDRATAGGFMEGSTKLTANWVVFRDGRGAGQPTTKSERMLKKYAGCYCHSAPPTAFLQITSELAGDVWRKIEAYRWNPARHREAAARFAAAVSVRDPWGPTRWLTTARVAALAM